MTGYIQSPILAWIQLALGVIAVVLALLSFNQAGANRSLQAAATANQSRLDRATTFANLDNGVVQLIAKTGSETNDPALIKLLADNGITFRKAPDAGAKP